jgi:hypothetical protein
LYFLAEPPGDGTEIEKSGQKHLKPSFQETILKVSDNMLSYLSMEHDTCSILKILWKENVLWKRKMITMFLFLLLRSMTAAPARTAGALSVISRNSATTAVIAKTCPSTGIIAIGLREH